MSEPNTLDRVRSILGQHKADILATYRAVGVGIGKAAPPSTSYLITVYLQSSADLPKQPVSVEGVPLQFTATGPIQPLHPGQSL